MSASLRKLADARYVRIEKRFRDRRPQTLCHLTDSGREAWLAYLDRMHKMLFGGGGD